MRFLRTPPLIGDGLRLMTRDAEATDGEGSRMDGQMGEKDNLPILSFPSRETWVAWLEEQHAVSKGVWLAIPKAGGGEAGVS